jgi:hypothetical protein
MASRFQEMFMRSVPCCFYMFALAAATRLGLTLNFYVNVQEQQDVRTTPGAVGHVGCGT